jgi:hypothetical protein
MMGDVHAVMGDVHAESDLQLLFDMISKEHAKNSQTGCPGCAAPCYGARN